MLYFMASLLIGVLLEIDTFNLPVLIPLFWHMLMVGWITQVIFGVSLWMFPGRNRKEGFRNQRLGWLAYFFLNLGLLLRIFAEPVLNYSESPIWKNLILISAIAQLSAVGTYVVEMWPRIQSKKQQRRQRRKKKKG